VIRNYPLAILSFVAAFSACCVPAHAQGSNPDSSVQEAITFPQPLRDKVNSLAMLLTGAIRKQRFERVVVLGAQGPGTDLSQFGSALGDLLSDDLQHSATDIQFENRDEIRRYLKTQRISAAMVESDALVPMICAEFKAKGWIKAELVKLDSNSLALNAHLFRTGKPDAKSIADWSVELELDSALQLARMTSMIPRDDFGPGPQDAGPKGWSEPRCEFCPHPDYTPEARRSGFQGEIRFSVLVSPDGRVEDIAVIKPARYDLNLAAIDSLRNWKLRPATDDKANRVRSRLEIAVTFELF